MRPSSSGRALLFAATVAAFAGVTILVLGYSRQESIEASGEAGMSLRVLDDTGQTVCGAGPVGRKCEVVDGTGTVFSVDVVTDPPPPTGFTGYQAVVQYESTLPLQQQSGTSENRWPECNPLLASEYKDVPNRYRINCGSGSIENSGYTGTLANVRFKCQGNPGQIDLVAGTVGDVSRYVRSGTPSAVFLKSVGKGSKQVADSVLIQCVDPTPTPTPTKQPPPGDTDGDGCTDQAENGADETLGGRRDYLNPWDFFDATGPGGGPPDKYIDLFNDIQGVVSRHTSSGGIYDPAFDRGPSTGPNPWNMTAPDGNIDLFNDILGVVFQYQHDCRP